MNYFARQRLNRRCQKLMFYFCLLELLALPFSYAVATAALLLGWVTFLYKVSRGCGSWKSTPLDIPIAIFAIFGLISVSVAPEPSFSFYNFWNLVGRYILTYYLVVQSINIPREYILQWITYALLGSLVVVVGYGFLQGIWGVGLDGQQAEWIDSVMFPGLTARVFSTWYNPNILGGYLDIMLGIIAGLWLANREPIFRIILGVLFVLTVVILAMTYARGACLSIVAVLGIYGLLYNRKLFIGIVVLAGIILLLDSTLATRILSTFTKLDSSSEMRLGFWTSTIAMIKDHPFLGIGWGEFYTVYPHYDYYMQGHYIKIVHAHNMYLNILAEIGIVGFFGFMATYFGGIYQAFKMRKAKYELPRGLGLGIGLGLLAMAINGLTDYVMFNVELSMLVWWLLALVMVLKRREV